MELYEARGFILFQFMGFEGGDVYLSLKKKDENFASVCQRAFAKSKINGETDFEVVCSYFVLEEGIFEFGKIYEEIVDCGIILKGDEICKKIEAYEAEKHIAGVRIDLTCTSPVTPKKWSFILSI